MRRMDLHAGEADAFGGAGGDRELGDDRGDLAAIHRARLAEEARRQAELDRRRGQRMRVDGLRRLPARMRKLRPEMGAVAARRRGPFAQPDALFAAGRLSMITLPGRSR